MLNDENGISPPIRWALVGGGHGSQIGYIHRCAARRDNNFSLVAGAFDVVPARGREFGMALGVSEDRCYASFDELIEKERRRKDGVQAISIATPNKYHYPMTKAALLADMHVICEKPLAFTIAEALELKQLGRARNRGIFITYGYTGFPMVHQAREMIRRGDLGDVRIINTQFAHGYHSAEVELHDPGLKWRVTPEMSGPTYVLGDVGTHALYLAETMVEGLSIRNLLCSRQSFVASRKPLEDNATVLLNFTNGAVGTLWCSAVNAGSTHQHKIRVIGSRASLEWHDEFPNQLRYERQGQPVQILDRGMGYLYGENDMVTADRIGSGHAEGLFEAWANLYRRFALAIQARHDNDAAALDNLWCPGIEAGIAGVTFIEACVRSAEAGSVWIDMA